MQIQDEPIIFNILPRSLQEPEYYLKIWFIRLTQTEAMATILFVFFLWVGGGITGIGQWRIFWIAIEPFGYIAVLIAVVGGISIGHHLRPEGSIDLVLAGWLTPTRFIKKQSGDPKWYPSFIRPHYRHSMIKEIKFSHVARTVKNSFKPIKKKKTIRPKKGKESTDE